MYKLNKEYFPYFQYQKATVEKSKGTIFFIHGYAVNSDYHNDFSDQLTNYDYYAVELPGHGISPRSNNQPFSPFGFAHDIAKLINDLDLKDLIVIGHSMGGGIAVMLSHLIENRIKKLILVTPMNSKGTKNLINFLFRFNPQNEKQLDKFYSIIMNMNNQVTLNKITPEERKRLINRYIKYKKTFKELKWKMFSLNNLLKMQKYEKHINIDTLLIVGKYDRCIHFKSTLKNFKKKKPNIKTYFFNKSGHVPFFEQPQEYYEVIMKFINSN